MTPEIALTAARNTGTPVRLTLDDGRVLAGNVERSIVAPFVLKRPGARPEVLIPADVLRVQPLEGAPA